MSRIGKMPVALPAGVTVGVTDGKMVVKGPKGTPDSSTHLTLPTRDLV